MWDYQQRIPYADPEVIQDIIRDNYQPITYQPSPNILSNLINHQPPDNIPQGFKALQGLLTSGNMADFYLTQMGLEKGLREGNPIANLFVGNPYLALPITGGLSQLQTALTSKLYKQSKPLGWGSLILMNLLKGLILGNNINLIRKY